MAKKKPAQESGPGIFMILALVFFILTTAVLGVTTYLGFKDADQWEQAKKKAEDDQKAAVKNAAEQTMRLDLYRMGVGTADDKVREEFNGGSREHQAAILEEQKLIMDKLGTANAFPTRNAFQLAVGRRFQGRFGR